MQVRNNYDLQLAKYIMQFGHAFKKWESYYFTVRYYTVYSWPCPHSMYNNNELNERHILNCTLF